MNTVLLFEEDKETVRKEFLQRLVDFIGNDLVNRNLLIKKFFSFNSKQVSYLELNINDYLD